MAQRIIDRNYVGEILQHIYDGKLNVQLTLNLEDGFFWVRHDAKTSRLLGSTIEEAVTHLASELAKQYPESDFADWWRFEFQSENLKQQ